MKKALSTYVTVWFEADNEICIFEFPKQGVRVCHFSGYSESPRNWNLGSHGWENPTELLRYVEDLKHFGENSLCLESYKAPGGLLGGISS
jgi:hypothetical protein